MAAVYTVSSGRNQKMTFTGSSDSLKVTYHQDYYVEVSGVAASSVSPYNVLTATGIPIVNRSVYYDGINIIPFVVCRDKTAEQNPDRLSRWKVSTKWESSSKSNQDENGNAPVTPPAALTNIAPRVVPTLGESEKIMYQDKANLPCTRTPARSRWSEPVMERIPTLTLQITQYEAMITYEQMLERKFKVNSSTYRGQPRYDWLIEHVEAVEVDVQLAGGPTTAAQVTYTVSHSPHQYGWKEDRALVDTHYLDSGLERLPFNDSLEGGSGYIDVSGLKRDSQGGIPDYIQYETYDDINFGSFLQV